MWSEHKIQKEVQALMLKNRRHAAGHSYTVPSPETYPFQWFWDSCFHAIILSHFDTDMAKRELLALAAKQFDNGMIPHMIYWEDPKKFPFRPVRWGKHRTSSIIQPPMLAYAAWAIFQQDRDTEFIRKILPVITRFHNYFLTDRDPYHHNVVGIVLPDESGEDNSPRFDTVLRLKPKQNIDANYHRRLLLIDRYRTQRFRIKQHMANFHWVRDVPMNAILVSNLLYESFIAEELQQLEVATHARQRSQQVAAAMREYMLEGSVMMSTMGLNYHHIEVKTWAMFAPLFAGILTPEEADQVVKKHLLNTSEFKTPFGIPTVAANEPSFDPNGFWRGPIWMSVNWFVYVGLLNYGYKQEAADILNDSAKLLELHGLREQYNPLTGEPQGAKHFTWGGLVLDMIAKQQ